MRDSMNRLQAFAATGILALGMAAIAVSPAVATPGHTPAYTPPVLNCGAGTVPGWLNEHGDPTSCVGDNPCPEVDFGVTCPADVVIVEPVAIPPVVPPVMEPVEVTPVAVDRLAETGPDDVLQLAGLAGLLLTAGGGLLMRRRRRVAATHTQTQSA